jgi:hypothetical protein
MPFISISTFEPEERSEVIKRRTKKGPMAACKIIGEWSSIAWGRVFRGKESKHEKSSHLSCLWSFTLGGRV